MKNCFSDRKLEKELVKKEWSSFAKKHLERGKKVEPSMAQPGAMFYWCQKEPGRVTEEPKVCALA